MEGDGWDRIIPIGDNSIGLVYREAYLAGRYLDICTTPILKFKGIKQGILGRRRINEYQRELFIQGLMDGMESR